MTTPPEAYLVGSGIGSLAAAAGGLDGAVSVVASGMWGVSGGSMVVIRCGGMGGEWPGGYRPRRRG